MLSGVSSSTPQRHGGKMDESRARKLVAGERSRIETALRELTDQVGSAGPLERPQTGETAEAGTELQMANVDMALVTDLRDQLAAVVRAEERLTAGTYGRSIVSGVPIPDERLEADPLAERTIGEQRALEADRA
jgi:DnaK suppressor protein